MNNFRLGFLVKVYLNILIVKARKHVERITFGDLHRKSLILYKFLLCFCGSYFTESKNSATKLNICLQVHFNK
jgi:hypothetical protein